MSIEQAKEILNYYNSTNHLFKNRPKTAQLLEAEQVLQSAKENQSYVPPAPKPKKSRQKINQNELQAMITAEMGQGYTLTFINPYPNSQIRRYYLLEDSTQKKYYMGKVVFAAAKTWEEKKEAIINFFKQ